MRDAFRATFIAARNTASKTGSPKPERAHLAEFNAISRAALHNAMMHGSAPLCKPIDRNNMTADRSGTPRASPPSEGDEHARTPTEAVPRFRRDAGHPCHHRRPERPALFEPGCVHRRHPPGELSERHRLPTDERGARAHGQRAPLRPAGREGEGRGSRSPRTRPSFRAALQVELDTITLPGEGEKAASDPGFLRPVRIGARRRRRSRPVRRRPEEAPISTGCFPCSNASRTARTRSCR